MTIKILFQVQYLVKWVGWEEETWEPELNLGGSEILISDFQTSQAATGSKVSTVSENLTNGEKGANPEEETAETSTTDSWLLSSKDPMQMTDNYSTDPFTSTDVTTLASTFENHDTVEEDTSVGQTETGNPLKMTASIESVGTSRDLVNIGEHLKSDENGGDRKPNDTNYERDVSEKPPPAF